MAPRAQSTAPPLALRPQQQPRRRVNKLRLGHAGLLVGVPAFIMIPRHYFWLIWTLSLALIWLLIYSLRRDLRPAMWRTSWATLPFALTEPLFVGSYWLPPSLFHLAARSHFDIESFIFCFATGGIAAVLPNVITGRPIVLIPKSPEMLDSMQYHVLGLMTPALVFCTILVISGQAIAAGIAALSAGALVRAWVLPDLRPKMLIGGLCFMLLYGALLRLLTWRAPGYINQVWAAGPRQLEIAGLPATELLFALAMGLYWSGVYEHFTFVFARATHGRRRTTLPTSGAAAS